MMLSRWILVTVFLGLMTACGGGGGDGSSDSPADTTAPVLAQVTPVSSPTNDNTPSYTFSSSEAGTVTYGGGCTSSATAAVAGNNTITLEALPDGTYSACTVRVTDAAGNMSATLNIATFIVDSTTPVPDPETADSVPIEYQLDPLLSEVAQSLIVKVTGTDGDHEPAEGPASIENSSASPFIAALTEDNEIVLASVFDDKSLILNTESTAVTLVKILMPFIHESLTQATIIEKIRNHALLPALTEAVDAALAAGNPPSTNDDVLLLAMQIVEQTSTELAESIRPAHSVMLKSAAVEVDDVATRYLPYTLYTMPVGKIYLTGGLSNIFNSTPIAWSAKPETYDGQHITIDPEKPEKDSVLLPGAGVYDWALAEFASNYMPFGVSVPNDEDRAYNITLLQNTESRTRNILELVMWAVKQVVSELAPTTSGTCVEELAEALIGDELAVMVQEGSREAFINYMASVGKNASKSVANLLVGAPRLCPGAFYSHRSQLIRLRIAGLAAQLNVYYRAYLAAQKVADFAQAGARVYWIYDTWNEKRTIKICVANGVVDNCSARFEFDRGQDVVLLEGARYTPEVTAYDAHDNITGTPYSIRFLSTSPAFTVNEYSGLVVAGNVPDESTSVAGVLTATDLPTGATGQATVIVDKGKLTPADQTLNMGDVGGVSVVSTTDKPIHMDGINYFIWETVEEGIVDLYPASDSPSFFNIRRVSPVAEGNATIFATNPISNTVLSAEVTVNDIGMLGDTITVARRYPTVLTLEEENWVTSSVAKTVVLGSSDQMDFLAGASQNIFTIVNAEKNDISFTLPVASLYLGSSTVFDGYVISGFRHPIASAVVKSNQTGMSIDIDHTRSVIYISMAGYYGNNAAFTLHVKFDP